MASTGSSSSVDGNYVEEVTQGTSMTTREEIADEDIHDDDGSSCYQVKLVCKRLYFCEVKRSARVFFSHIDRPLSPLGMHAHK